MDCLQRNKHGWQSFHRPWRRLLYSGIWRGRPVHIPFESSTFPVYRLRVSRENDWIDIGPVLHQVYSMVKFILFELIQHLRIVSGYQYPDNPDQFVQYWK